MDVQSSSAVDISAMGFGMACLAFSLIYSDAWTSGSRVVSVKGLVLAKAWTLVAGKGGPLPIESQEKVASDAEGRGSEVKFACSGRVGGNQDQTGKKEQWTRSPLLEVDNESNSIQAVGHTRKTDFRVMSRKSSMVRISWIPLSVRATNGFTVALETGTVMGEIQPKPGRKAVKH